MSNFRFRVNFYGVLVLQKLSYKDGPAEYWVDAKVSDLEQYYKERNVSS